MSCNGKRGAAGEPKTPVSRATKLTGRPGTSTRVANRQPACGCSCNSSGERECRAVVTYRVLRSSPPKQGMVGQRTGTAISASTSPAGEIWSTRPPSYIAHQ